MPRLRTLPFETQIIERYRRKESSVEEALVEMYLAGVSVRRVESITEALWGAKVSHSTVSDLNQKIYGKIEEWRMRPIEGEHPYVFVDGVYLKRRETPTPNESSAPSRKTWSGLASSTVFRLSRWR